MPPSKTRAVVLEAAEKFRMRDFQLPDIDEDSALLRVEACGICGTDAEQYYGVLKHYELPLIPGHEPVGVIERIGDRAAKRWGVDVGDRIAVETMIPCGHCSTCIGGRYTLCRSRGRMFAYAFIPLATAPGLWGAYADYMYLDPNTIVHKIRKDIPAGLAVMFNPLGAGFRWAVELPNTGPGDTVLILGPGQRGLASVIAARAAGADKIIVTGLKSDEQKLKLAREFGADATIVADEEDVRKRVLDLTSGKGAEVVIEVTSNSTRPVAESLHYAAMGARVVFAGAKGRVAIPDFISDLIVGKEITIMGALGVDSKAYRAAIRLIESGKLPLEKMHTHEFPLEDAETAIRTLAGKADGDSSVHSCLLAAGAV